MIRSTFTGILKQSIKSIILFGVLFFCVNLLIFSQLSVSDSLYAEIEKHGETKVLEEISIPKDSYDSLDIEMIEFAIYYSRVHELHETLSKLYIQKAQLSLEQDEISECIFYCLEVLELCKNYNIPLNEKKVAYITLSEGFQEMGAFDESIKHRTQYLELTNWEVWDEEISNSLSFIGNLYLRKREYDSAYQFYDRARIYSEKFNQERSTAEALNNLGLTVYKIPEFDSAANFFEAALEIYRSKHTPEDSLKVGIITGNLAICYPLKKEKEKIVELVNEQIQITKRYKDYDALSIAYFEMCNTYYNLKDYKKTQIYLDSVLSTNLLRKQNEDAKYQRLGIYGSYGHIARLLRDFDKTVHFHDLYYSIYDSLYGAEITEELVQSVTQYRVSGIKSELKLKKALLKQSQDEIKSMEQEKNLSKLKVVFASVTGILLLAIGGIVFNKMKSEHKRKLEIKELNEQILEATVKHKTDRLTQSALSMTRKVDFSKELISKLSKIKGIEAKDLSPIKVFISNEFRMDESFLEMENYIAELSEDFFVKLKGKFPELTENEIKLCGLIRLELSNKEIAVIKNNTLNTIKVAKTRLSKKLDLTPGSSILAFLKSI